MYLIVKFVSLDILYRGMTGIVVLEEVLWPIIVMVCLTSVRSDLQACTEYESCVVEINRIKARKLFIFTLYKAPDRKLEILLKV